MVPPMFIFGISTCPAHQDTCRWLPTDAWSNNIMTTTSSRHLRPHLDHSSPLVFQELFVWNRPQWLHQSEYKHFWHM